MTTLAPADDYTEGYPSSTEADLDPGPALTTSLEDADREVGREQRHALEGRRPDGSIEDEEHIENGDAIDDVESLHELAGGRT